MFYAFDFTPLVDDTEAAPHVLDLGLTAGVIHQVDVLFQSGCNHQIFVKIFHGKHQLWPTNDGGKMRGDATVISFREFYELFPGNTRLYAKIYTTLTTYDKEVVINIGVLPKAILQPLSFEELLAAAAG